MAIALMISENKLKQSTAINGNVDPKFLLPYVTVAQEKYIHTRLGSDLYNKIGADIQAGTLTGDYKALVDDYIAPSLVHWSFYELSGQADISIRIGSNLCSANNATFA